MKNMEVQIQLPIDLDGFLDYCCPTCEKHFRLNTNEFQGDNCVEVLFCPYCGLNFSPDEFMPPKIKEYIEAEVVYYAEQKVQEELKKMARSSKLLTYKPSKLKEPEKIILDESISTHKYCKKCDKDFKIDESAVTYHYCPYCGEII